MCVIGALYIHFGVPETKARTLDEIDQLFGDTSGRSRMEAEMLEQAHRDVGLLALAGIEGKQTEKAAPSESNHDEKDEKGEYRE